MPPQGEPVGVAFDACALLNLAGAGLALAEVADALGMHFFVTEQAAAEALWIEDVEDEKPVRLRVDLAQAGDPRVEVVGLTEEELAQFVSFAAEVDDGEAATIAIALNRRLAMATDDRKALRVARDAGVPVLGTPYLLRRWTERQGMTPADVTSLLRRVERRARFRPRSGDPQHDWWSHHVEQ